LIFNDRSELQVDRSLIKHCLYVYEDLDITNPYIVVEGDGYKWEGEKTFKKYEEWFETFEKETTTFVKNKANLEISTFSAIEYINSALRYINLENERKLEYIHKNYRSKIDRINIKYLIEENIHTLIKVRNLNYFRWVPE
jgi:hypothetical protein